MILIILLVIMMVVFLLSITLITLSDTETFKAIDKRIANKIERKGKKK